MKLTDLFVCIYCGRVQTRQEIELASLRFNSDAFRCSEEGCDGWGYNYDLIPAKSKEQAESLSRSFSGQG